MTPNDLLELFRLETDDLFEPYLWSDKEFFIYLNEAQDKFVREMGGFADRRSAITRVKYKIGDQFRPYDPRILRIRGAQDETNKFIGIENLDSIGSPTTDDYGARSNAGLDDGLTGPIQFLITDIDNNDMQLYPLPDHDGTLQLFVQRLPITPIEDGDSIFELKDIYHLDLLSWVKYRAYMKQDVETFDGTKAASFRNMFTDAAKSATKEKASREDRKRTVKFSW